jgi:hypothetical protein
MPVTTTIGLPNLSRGAVMVSPSISAPNLKRDEIHRALASGLSMNLPENRFAPFRITL